MSLEITHYTEGSPRKTKESFSISKFISILDFFNYITRECNTHFEFVSLVLKKPHFMSSGSYSNSSNKVLQNLHRSAYLKRVETNGLVIHIGKGVIYDDNKNILLCLSIETQYIFDAIENGTYKWTNFSSHTGEISYKPFVMFVSTEFANNKEFAVLYRRIKKIYLDFCFEKGIEMRLISSSKIKENTFTNSLNIKFDSLTELNRHLTEDVKYLLQVPLEDFKEKSFPLLLDSPPITISKQESAVEKGTRVHEEMEKFLIRTPSVSGDSMLEDSDLDERAFEQEIVNINLENLPSQTLSEMMDRLNSQPLTWDEPITSDRSMAAAMAIIASQRRSFRDMATELVGIPNRYFTAENSDSITITQERNVEDIIDRFSNTSEQEVEVASINSLYDGYDFPDASIDEGEEEQEYLPY